MSKDYFRVRILRRVSEAGRDRWVRVVDDGIVIDRRHGANGGWVRVVAPSVVEGVPISRNPDTAEWYPMCARGLRVIQIGRVE